MDSQKVYIHVRNEDGSYDIVYPITSADNVILNGAPISTQLSEISNTLSYKIDKSK